MGLDHGKLKQAKAGARAGSGWKPKAGDNIIRILPPNSAVLQNWEELENLALAYKLHYFRIEGRPTEVSLCLEENKQRCPACEAWRIHHKSEDLGLKEMAKQIAPADSYLMNIIDLGNVSTGIQRWGANWTSWDKIMDIASNPAWGNVVDPANGIDFNVIMTPKGQSRSGYNAYNVVPNGGQRTTVMAILDQIEGWQASLDLLPEQKAAPKEAEEIKGLLGDMGFPGYTPATIAPATPLTPAGAPAPNALVATVAPAVAAPAVAAPVAPIAAAIAPPAVALPPAAPVAPPPVATPVVVPGAVAPVAAPMAAAPVALPAAVAPVAAAPVAAAPVAPAPAPAVAVTAPPGPMPITAPATPAPATVAPAPVAVAPVAPAAVAPTTAPPGTLHYDPGAEYTPKFADDKRPAGVPRCYGDYLPQTHRCAPCPVIAGCQMLMVGVAD